jgi:hypothetical protein
MEFIMANESPAFIEYLKEANKFLTDTLKEKSTQLQRLQEENWILRDEVSAWENTARIRGWSVSLVYPTKDDTDLMQADWRLNPGYVPAHQLEDEDIPF